MTGVVTMDTFIITCEHSGKRIPAPYRQLFNGQQALLNSHRGYDLGALIKAKTLASDVGLLYHPGRPEEAKMCARWKESLAACTPELHLRRNYPYAGKTDGLTSHLRLLFAQRDYVGIELAPRFEPWLCELRDRLGGHPERFELCWVNYPGESSHPSSSDEHSTPAKSEEPETRSDAGQSGFLSSG
ncbi:MAG: hypothetical protein K2Q25_07615 [Mycobacteriaceae bacterium]|nr:hypothetical protein [Mycobacteriaceae bacterium]